MEAMPRASEGKRKKRGREREDKKDEGKNKATRTGRGIVPK